MLWLDPALVAAALPKGRTFVADPKVDPIAQMREVYRPDMYVLMFQDGKKADQAMDRDSRGSLRNSYRKNLITSAEWGKLPAEVANMEYYGKAIPKELPGRGVLTAQELDFYAGEFERTGMSGALARYRNMDRDWEDLADGGHTGPPVTQPSLFIGGSLDASTSWLADAIDAHPVTLPALTGSHILEGCGHWLQQERPEETNALLTGWLKSLPG
jgi:pimeloyl-ACP methyl ester carboxylesterase